jgi:hypothetical protein
MPEWLNTYLFILAFVVGSLLVASVALVAGNILMGEKYAPLAALAVILFVVFPVFCWYMER